MESTQVGAAPVASPVESGILSLDFATYLSIDAVSSHRLGLLAKSPAHLRYAIDNPSPPSDALRFGSAVHCAVLEPKLFAQCYAVAPKVDRRTKDGKATWAQFLADNKGKEFVDEGERIDIEGIRESLMRHDTASALIENVDQSEVTGIWRDERTNLRCKMRADALAPFVSTIFDLKTTNDASRREFERSIFKYGYHRQAALYLDGMRAIGRDFEHYAFIAVEKEPPYAVAVYRLQDDIIDLGRKQNAALMDLYKRCLDANEWPAYPSAVQNIGIPMWAKKQIEEDYLL